MPYNHMYYRHRVAPRVGAWIETVAECRQGCVPPSLPVWERGLKLDKEYIIAAANHVAPRVGAWIETIAFTSPSVSSNDVAPRVGAWIETANLEECAPTPPSLPVWERGLKPPGKRIDRARTCRSPCGSVD